MGGLIVFLLWYIPIWSEQKLPIVTELSSIASKSVPIPLFLDASVFFIAEQGNQFILLIPRVTLGDFFNMAGMLVF